MRLSLPISLLAVCLAVAEVTAPVPERPLNGLELRIDKVAQTQGMVVFYVSVRNRGKKTLYLKTILKGSRQIGTFGIEEYRQDEGWVHVGVYGDAPALGVLALRPGEEIRRVERVSDPFSNLRTSATKRVPVVGRHRAVLSYFTRRKKAEKGQGASLAISPEVEVPAREGSAAPLPPRVEVPIDGFRRAHSSVIFAVRIANRGRRPVYLKAIDSRGKELAGVAIGRYREPEGWAGFGGRWIDSVPAKLIVRLRPGQEAGTRVWIPDPFVEILRSPPRRAPVLGKHRATVWYHTSEKGARRAKHAGWRRASGLRFGEPLGILLRDGTGVATHSFQWDGEGWLVSVLTGIRPQPARAARRSASLTTPWGSG